MLKKIHNYNSHHPNLPLILLVLVANLFLYGCMASPPRYSTVAAETIQPAPPPVKVYFYPNRGQSQEQQGRDSYECYLWAVNQTGFDPSAPYLAPHHKLAVVPDQPPGTDTAVGAITGAMLGAAVSSRGNRPEGALVGAVAGALVGSASDAARQEQTYRLQQHYDRQAGKHMGNIERQAANYRRAMAACLEGRGYSVQ
ncbi:MAG: glycine zipper family protein [Thermodesulfobacteriota bacterium]